MKEFLKAITNQFDIGPDTGHVAMVSYSSKPKVELRFDTLQGSRLTKDVVNSYIDKMSHQRGLTYIDRALRISEDRVFATWAGMRKDVPQVSLVTLIFSKT